MCVLAVGCMWMTENHGMPVSWIPSGENGVASVGLLASIPITWPRPSRVTSEQGVVGEGWCGGAWAWPLYSHLRGHNDWSKTLAGVSSPANQNSCPKSLHLKWEEEHFELWRGAAGVSCQRERMKSDRHMNMDEMEGERPVPIPKLRVP